MSGSETAIETTDLTKHYGAIVAVDHLNLSVNRGEIFGFLGPNGSGKSTTMRMLLGLARPTAGRAQVFGLDVHTHLPEILRRTGALIENPTFYPFLSGRENLRVMGDLTGTPDSRVEVVLGLVDMQADADRPFSSYSLGMKQRIGVAGTLLTEPELLILDEPGNGLDPAGIVEMRTLMQQLRTAGHTVFVSSHVLHEIEQVCDRIAILNHGKVVAQGSVQELLGATDRVEIQVTPLEEAAAVLRALPWVSGVAVEGGALLVTVPIERSADLTRALGEHGMYPSVIRPRQESLERYFLELTGAAA
ncbi:MAG TPA: ABC transporter ATP-binding protein [Chloroflexota bacterium]|nr:ABC transporter ATP-binding protein [Chloroflexota bacterium]